MHFGPLALSNIPIMMKCCQISLKGHDFYLCPTRKWSQKIVNSNKHRPTLHMRLL